MNFFQIHKQSDIKNTAAASAGSKLLNRYKTEWSELHQNSVNSNSRAKELNEILLEYSKKLKVTEEKINKFHIQLQVLPDLVSQVDELASNLEELEMSVLRVSCSLDLYEKICGEHDECNRRQEALCEIDELKMRKRQELESIKSELAKDHAEKISRVQIRQQSTSAERQKVIIDAISSVKDLE